MNWIFNVGLNGIIGTVVALVVAIYTLRKTLEHDRRLAEEAPFLDDCRTAERDATELSNLLREANTQPGGLPPAEHLPVTVRMWGLNTSIRHLAHRERIRENDDVAELLEKASAKLIFTKVTDVRVANCAQNLAEILRWRVTDPSRLRSGVAYYPSMLESLDKAQPISIG